MDVEVCSSYHLGHMLLGAMKKHPHYLSQIDAATGKEQTYETVTSNSIRLAKCMRTFGLKPGDVLAISGKNHLNIFVPLYAGLFNGQPIIGVDPNYKFDEIKTILKITKPRILFCQITTYNDFVQASRELCLETEVITFDEGDNSLSQFVHKYDDGTPADLFKVAEFDTEKNYAFLCSTSGTTGTIKAAALQHKHFIFKILAYFKHGHDKQNSPNISNPKYLHLSPVNWVSSTFTAVFTPLLGVCIVMTSNPDDPGLIIEMINKYRPVNMLISPTLGAYLMSRKEEVDLTCLHSVAITGAKSNQEVIAEIRTRLNEKAQLSEYYGLTETLGPILLPNNKGPVGSCGSSSSLLDIKLVDIETESEIKDPHVSGEMWYKGPMFCEYYNDPKATAEALSSDGYFKTGDILYRDENNNYFFVDRKKTLIKYKNYQVSPSEIEDLINTHPGVDQVVVVGIPDIQDGEHPVACVIRKKGSSVTAQEIKDLVANKLSSSKELRGGVVFLDTLPMTSTDKIARAKLAKLVLNLKKN